MKFVISAFFENLSMPFKFNTSASTGRILMKFVISAFFENLSMPFKFN